MPLNLTLLKSCQVVGVFWGAFAARDPRANAANTRELFALYEKGAIRPRVSKTFPLAEAGQAIAWLAGRNDPGFTYNGPLAGLVAVCAGSDIMHPLGALVTGGIAGVLFVYMFTCVQNRWRIDDVLGVWPLHGLCGAWGGLAAGIFGLRALGGMGGVSFGAQLVGTLGGIVVATLGGTLVYGAIRLTVGLRLDPEDEYNGADLSIHKISATSE